MQAAIQYRFHDGPLETTKDSCVRTLALATSMVCLGTLIAGCDQKQAAGNEQQPATPVKTAIIAPVAISESSEYLGTLKSRHSVMLNPQVEGQVTRILVKSGDRVTAGARLMEIDPLRQQATVQGQQASIAAQKANVELARSSTNAPRNCPKPA